MTLRVEHAPIGWLRRLFEAFPWPAWKVGVLLALVGVLLLGLQEFLLGRHHLAVQDPSIASNLWVAVTHILITAYLVTATVYAERTTSRSIDAILPSLDEDRIGTLLGHTFTARIASVSAVVVGAILFVFVNLRISPGDVSLAPSSWDPETAWHRVLGFAMAILTARLFVFMGLESTRLSMLAGAIAKIDLLSSEAIAPFARQGLTYSLLVIGVVSAFALFLVDLRYLPLFGFVFCSTLLISGIALLLPLRGIRTRIIEAKRAELVWCQEQMRARREAIATNHRTQAPPLEELVAWEARVHAVREWPIDASTFSRFALYLLLPLGSWAGGALVERGIDALLD